MAERKLGVLGGMGPLATSVFFKRLIENTVAQKDQEHIDVVILNHATLPDRTEAILSGNEKEFLDEVKKDLEIFKSANVSSIVIPCNTSHYFFDSIQAMTEINIMNMVEKTIEFIDTKIELNKKVAILATDGTILSRVYENECEKHHIECYIPPKEIQKDIMNMIYSIKSNPEYDSNELNIIIRDLITHQKCTSVVLGCTELSCVELDDDNKKYCVDPVDILVEHVIKASGKQSIKSLLNE